MTIGELASKSGTRASLVRYWEPIGILAASTEHLDSRIVQLKVMRHVFGRVSNRQCAELADCGRMAASVIMAAR